MKRIIALFVLMTLLCTLPAFAAVSATPNQELAFRTGPNTAFVWLYHKPQSTPITAYEYESGNDVTWVLVEFQHEGFWVRGYTGLKRMSVNGNIPWANHRWIQFMPTYTTTVWSAPRTPAMSRGTLTTSDTVSLLEFVENGYAFVEFMTGGERNRGYIDMNAVPGYLRGEITPGTTPQPTPTPTPVPTPQPQTGLDLFNSSAVLQYARTLRTLRATGVYDSPTPGARLLYTLPSNSYVVAVGRLYNGYEIVQYGSTFGFVNSADLARK